ncbi:hypothetical protein [Pedobacter jeongneungensis]|uniref:hypothetical protein n=1 Tax=Pedobacter jeongneungensis TaxID=947309 RepID=UPI0004691EA6|nr:hypothetical protein [Pedobacter jeongneungensis]
MGKVKFTAAFSGGEGTLKITFEDKSSITFTADGSLEADLKDGSRTLMFSGTSPESPQGNIHLEISGQVAKKYIYNFPPGNITADPAIIFVTGNTAVKSNFTEAFFTAIDPQKSFFRKSKSKGAAGLAKGDKNEKKQSTGKNKKRK